MRSSLPRMPTAVDQPYIRGRILTSRSCGLVLQAVLVSGCAPRGMNAGSASSHALLGWQWYRSLRVSWQNLSVDSASPDAIPGED